MFLQPHFDACGVVDMLHVARQIDKVLAPLDIIAANRTNDRLFVYPGLLDEVLDSLDRELHDLSGLLLPHCFCCFLSLCFDHPPHKAVVHDYDSGDC